MTVVKPKKGHPWKFPRHLLRSDAATPAPTTIKRKRRIDTPKRREHDR